MLLHELTRQQVLSRVEDDHSPLISLINLLIFHYSAVHVIYLFMLLLTKQRKLHGVGGDKKPKTLQVLITLSLKLTEAEKFKIEAATLSNSGSWAHNIQAHCSESLPTSRVVTVTKCKALAAQLCYELEEIHGVHWNTRISLNISGSLGMEQEIHFILRVWRMV